MPDRPPRKTMPILALIAGGGLIALEASQGNLVSFWAAVGLITVVLAMVELVRRG
jgi:hypothetical protein